MVVVATKDVVLVLDTMVPWLPGRSEANRSSSPSGERLGDSSCAGVLTGGPRLAGAPQAAFRLPRRET